MNELNPGDRVHYLSLPGRTGTVHSPAPGVHDPSRFSYRVQWDGERFFENRTFSPDVLIPISPATGCGWLVILTKDETELAVGLALDEASAKRILTHQVDWLQYPDYTGSVRRAEFGKLIPAPEESRRTTKYVTMELRVTYHGDYIAADDVYANVQGILDGAFEDRDDLRSWTVGPADVREVTGDPEGYDR